MTKKSAHNLFHHAKTHTRRKNVTTHNTVNSDRAEQNTNIGYLDHLPLELHQAISEYLDVSDLANLARTNKNQQNKVYATPVASFGIWDTNYQQQRHLRSPTFKEISDELYARRKHREDVRQDYAKKLRVTEKIRDTYGRLSDTADHPKVKTAAYMLLCVSQIVVLVMTMDEVMLHMKDKSNFTAFSVYSLQLLAAMVSPLNSMLIYDGANFVLGKLYERSETSHRELREAAEEMDEYLAEQPSRVFFR